MRPRLERNDADRSPDGDGSRDTRYGGTDGDAGGNADGVTDGIGSTAKRAIGPQRGDRSRWRQRPSGRTRPRRVSRQLPGHDGAGGGGRPKPKDDEGTDVAGNDAEAKGDSDGGPGGDAGANDDAADGGADGNGRTTSRALFERV